MPGDSSVTTQDVSLAAASDGTLHVVATVKVGGKYDCFYFSLPAGSPYFTTPVNVSNSPADDSLDPVVILDGSGTPTVIWSEIVGGGRDIVFSRQQP